MSVDFLPAEPESRIRLPDSGESAPLHLDDKKIAFQDDTKLELHQ